MPPEGVTQSFNMFLLLFSEPKDEPKQDAKKKSEMEISMDSKVHKWKGGKKKKKDGGCLWYRMHFFFYISFNQSLAENLGQLILARLQQSCKSTSARSY